MNIDVAALTQGALVPSTRFRVRQYVPELLRRGVQVHELTARFGAYPPRAGLARPVWAAGAVVDGLWRVMRAMRSDVCLLQRNLVSSIVTWEPAIRAPIVFDVDDAIFAGPKGGAADRIARRARFIVCGNRFLESHFCRHGETVIIPTAVDTEYFRPSALRTNRPVIGWSGSSSGLPYLYEIEQSLGEVLRRVPDAVLRVIADRAPRFSSIPDERVDFVRWRPDNEVEAVQGFSIGLMPLRDTIWERGKCSFKMLTYMAVGVPVVVSPVGMNNEVLALGRCGLAAGTTDEWIEAMTAVLRNESIAHQMGDAGRRIVEENYSVRVIAPRLAQVLRRAAA